MDENGTGAATRAPDEFAAMMAGLDALHARLAPPPARLLRAGMLRLAWWAWWLRTSGIGRLPCGS